MTTPEMLPDGCFGTHDTSKSYCSEYAGRKAEYPRFKSIDELKPIEYWAEKLSVVRRHLADGRYEKPPLPFIRYGRRILLAESQLVWWLNEIQVNKPDTYFLDRKRRVAEGGKAGGFTTDKTKRGQGKRGPNKPKLIPPKKFRTPVGVEGDQSSRA